MNCRPLVFLLLLLPQIIAAAGTPADTRGWMGLGYVYHRSGDGPAWLHVQRVAPDGPAYAAGIRPQDIITRIDGRAIPDETAVLGLAVNVRRGQEMRFTVLRQRQTTEIRVTAIALPPDRFAMWEANAKAFRKRSKQR